MMRRRAMAAVEFALTVPVLLIIGLGLVEWGWLFTRQVAAIQSVRDGALAGSCVRANADPEGVARGRVVRALNASGMNGSEAVVTAVVTTVSTGRVITVTVSVPYHRLVNLVPTPTLLEWQATMAMVDS